MTIGRRRRTSALCSIIAALGVATVTVVAGGTDATAAPTSAVTYAPVDQPGPALSVPQATLDAAVTCSQDPATATRDVILAVPPTALDPEMSYGWSYFPGFAANKWPYCVLTVPDHGDGDVQVAAEYVVNAVRRIYAESHRQVELFGWSQGDSTSPRWALRWWPDIRPMVASMAGFAPDNETGGGFLAPICTIACFPAAWQELRRNDGKASNFITAMNSGQQTFPGIAYTSVYSLTDELAGPNIGPRPVSPLPAAPNVLNVSEQSICPLNVEEHLTFPASPSAYAVVMAALATPGKLPDVSALDKRAICSELFQPNVSLASFVTNEAKIAAVVPQRILTGMITSEPPLRCYVYANGTCPGKP
ncbi:MAG: putative lipase [Marmoricola sp.]|nr:putative lipase [Marmoricola sp.]